MLAISKKKGKGSARSRMLRAIMPKLSGVNAEKLSKALDAENPEQFKSIWKDIGKQISKTLEK